MSSNLKHANDSEFNSGNIFFQTIQRCADELSKENASCDTCNILPGTYHETINIVSESKLNQKRFYWTFEELMSLDREAIETLKGEMKVIIHNSRIR